MTSGRGRVAIAEDLLAGRVSDRKRNGLAIAFENRARVSYIYARRRTRSKEDP